MYIINIGSTFEPSHHLATLEMGDSSRGHQSYPSVILAGSTGGSPPKNYNLYTGLDKPLLCLVFATSVSM